MDNAIGKIKKNLNFIDQEDTTFYLELNQKLNSFGLYDPHENYQLLTNLDLKTKPKEQIREELLSKITRLIEKKAIQKELEVDPFFTNNLIQLYLFQDIKNNLKKDYKKSKIKSDIHLSLNFLSKMVPRKIIFKNLMGVNQDKWEVYNKKILLILVPFWVLIYSLIFYYYYY